MKIYIYMRDVFKERKADKSVPQKNNQKIEYNEGGEKYMNSCMQIFWFCLELNIET